MNTFNCADQALKSNIIGVWHRPNSSERETSLEGLCAVLDEFQSAGINLVFLETFFHGTVIFKSELVDYREKLACYEYGDYPDYMSAFVSEAEKRGISTHAWVQDFYVGVEEDKALIADHPDWMLINQHGKLRHTTEGHGFGGYLFLDPANPEVRSFLTSLYDEILSRFPAVKGLNLDYIRYPISIIEDDTDTGYTEVSMRGFADQQGIALEKTLTPDAFNKLIKENALEDAWIAYRASYITSFVKGIREMVDEKHSGRLVSTAIFPEIEQTYSFKKQSIKVWLDNRYIDLVTPMVHFYGAQQVGEAVKNLKSMCNGAKCYTGLYTTYHNQTTDELAEHIDASIDAGAEGTILFDAAKTFFEAKHDYHGFLSQRYGRA
jgi:uncharacterized lipoprotein YddW (UPF0748 family)